MGKVYVGVVLAKEDGSVLAQLRDDNPEIDFPNQWSTIGGLKEPDEVSIKAALRELKEETDYQAEEDSLSVVLEDDFVKPSGEEVRRIVYWGRYDGRQEINTNEGQEIRFLSRRELDVIPNIIEIDKPVFESVSGKALENLGVERKG